MRARLAALLVAVVSVTAMPFFTSSADAWTNGPCTTTDGVTVVIDFQELGGGIHVRCAPGPVGSGFAALSGAGVDYQTTVRFPGFLCKIAGKPANDPCIDASPATAYWSYWLASRGGVWCYSNWGAGNRTPPAGSVEGWSFSLNKTASTSPPPGIAPPAAIPGVTTSGLAANDCDPRASAPKPTQPASPTTTRVRPSTTTTPATTSKPRTPTPASGRSTGGGSTPRSAGPDSGAGASGGTSSKLDKPSGPEDGAGPAAPAADGPHEFQPGDEPTDSSASDVEVESQDLTPDDSELAESSDTSTPQTESAMGEQPDHNDLADDHGGSATGVVIAFALMIVLATGAVVYRRRTD